MASLTYGWLAWVAIRIAVSFELNSKPRSRTSDTSSAGQAPVRSPPRENGVTDSASTCL